MASLGVHMSMAVYLKKNTHGEMLIACLYVDDLLFIEYNQHMFKKIQACYVRGVPDDQLWTNILPWYRSEATTRWYLYFSEKYERTYREI